MLDIVWDMDEEVDGNVLHIAQHGLTKDDVATVLRSPDAQAKSASSGRPMRFGFTDDGRYIAVVFEWIGEDSVYPVTAYEID
jgi:hypothetical protein